MLLLAGRAQAQKNPCNRHAEQVPLFGADSVESKGDEGSSAESRVTCWPPDESCAQPALPLSRRGCYPKPKKIGVIYQGLFHQVKLELGFVFIAFFLVGAKIWVRGGAACHHTHQCLF
jgi:hypothetical protein